MGVGITSSSWAGIRCWRCGCISRDAGAGVELRADRALSRAGAGRAGRSRATAPAERALPPITRVSRARRCRCRSRSSGCGSWRRWPGQRGLSHPAGLPPARRAGPRRASRGAWIGLVARHEALRTTFAPRWREPVQADRHPGVGFALLEDDLRRSRARRPEAGGLAAEEAAAPFDLRGRAR